MQPIHNLPFFEYQGVDDKNYRKYTINPNKLSDDECHLFFTTQACEELMIVTILENFFFHHSTKLNEKFNINPVVCGDIELFWCSFPKEFKEICETMGRIFELTMKNNSRVYVDSRGTILQVPEVKQIFSFSGEHRDFRKPEVQKMFDTVCENAVKFGNYMHSK